MCYFCLYLTKNVRKSKNIYWRKRATGNCPGGPLGWRPAWNLSLQFFLVNFWWPSVSLKNSVNPGGIKERKINKIRRCTYLSFLQFLFAYSESEDMLTIKVGPRKNRKKMLDVAAKFHKLTDIFKPSCLDVVLA